MCEKPITSLEPINKDWKAIVLMSLKRLTQLSLLGLTMSMPVNATASNQIIVGSDLFTGVGYLMRTSIDSGGGTLLTVTGTDGDSGSLSGGNGTSIELGVRLDLRPFQRPAFGTELTVGIKTASLTSGSGSADFTHTTIALSQFYRFKNKFRLGAGIGISLSPELEINVPGFEAARTSFDAAPEYRAMLEYGFTRWFAVGGRFRVTEWTSDDRSVDGTNAGIYLTIQSR